MTVPAGKAHKVPNRSRCTRLQNAGLPVAAGTAPAGARLLGSVSSPPLLDLLEQMLEQSDNVLAEALARQVAIATGAPTSFEGASVAITSVLGALALPGLDAGSLSLADASGLSTLQRAAPGALAAILRAASDGAHPRLAPLIGGLPVAGWDGTLFDRYLAAGDPSTGSFAADPARGRGRGRRRACQERDADGGIGTGRGGHRRGRPGAGLLPDRRSGPRCRHQRGEEGPGRDRRAPRGVRVPLGPVTGQLP